MPSLTVNLKPLEKLPLLMMLPVMVTSVSAGNPASELMLTEDGCCGSGVLVGRGIGVLVGGWGVLVAGGMVAVATAGGCVGCAVATGGAVAVGGAAVGTGVLALGVAVAGGGFVAAGAAGVAVGLDGAGVDVAGSVAAGTVVVSADSTSTSSSTASSTTSTLAAVGVSTTATASVAVGSGVALCGVLVGMIVQVGRGVFVGGTALGCTVAVGGMAVAWAMASVAGSVGVSTEPQPINPKRTITNKNTLFINLLLKLTSFDCPLILPNTQYNLPMTTDLMLRRKWTFRANNRQVVFIKNRIESTQHVLMKAFIWALYLPEYPDLRVEVRIGDRYKPDVVQLDRFERSPLFWGEAGVVSKQKIESLTRRFRGTHFAIGKWDSDIGPTVKTVRKAVGGLKRTAPFDVIRFRADSAEKHITSDGKVTITHDDVERVRIE